VDPAEKKTFCDRWLDAWTGNRPDRLIEFYAEDELFYRDPAHPGGITDRGELRAYFGELLAAFPDWEWDREELFPVDPGFFLKWRVSMVREGETVHQVGLDIVFLNDEGKIWRNEVYFNPLPGVFAPRD